MLYMDEFLATLPVMGKGMGGIFIVTAVIILSIVLLNGLAGLSAKKRGDRDAR